MTTQSELVHRLNQLTLRYNLTWYDISRDADNAITHINNFMGTKYPPMSVYMNRPDGTYRFRASKRNVEIFPDRYIHSVVIPYIAIQILARDEEFTQVYQKYQQDLDDGLYQMFQNEFNRVPYEFRQNPDQGVFFSPESIDEAERIRNFHHHNRKDALPSPKFLVTYHVNSNDLYLTNDFVKDTKGYMYEDTVQVKGYNHVLYSYDGIFSNTLEGWTLDKSNSSSELLPGDTLQVTNDVDLFAIWNREYTIAVNNENVVTFKNKAKDSLVNVVLPERVHGRLITTIPADFTKDMPRLRSVTLPPKLTLIKQDAFRGFSGSEILFNTNYPEDIKIEGGAFDLPGTITSIVIPENVRTIESAAFTRNNDIPLTIYVRTLKENIPAWDNTTKTGWKSDWFTPSDYIKVVYGWNG